MLEPRLHLLGTVVDVEVRVRGRHDRDAVTVAERVRLGGRIVHERHHVRGLGVDRGHPRLVHHREVVTVGGVLELDLPVALEPELVTAEDLGGESVGLLQESLHPDLRVTQVVFERFDLGVERREDHAEIALGAQLLQGEVVLLDDALVTVRVRDAAQSTVEGVRPVVVRAGEAVGLAAALVAHRRPAMPAPVEQGVEVALAIPGHDDRLVPDLGGLERARLGDLALVRDPHPGAVEDLAHLLGEDLGIGVQLTGDAVLLGEVREAAGRPLDGGHRCSFVCRPRRGAERGCRCARDQEAVLMRGRRRGW